MRVVDINLNDLAKQSIYLGYAGEKNHVKVIIHCPALFRSYPDAVATMVARPPVGDLYPVTIERDGKTLVWETTEADLAYAGSGEFQITFTQDGEVVKTAIGRYSIDASLVATGEPPTPLEDWLEEAQEALESFEQDTSDAEAWANGTRDGEPVDQDDPAYNKNAKYYAARIGSIIAKESTETEPDLDVSDEDGYVVLRLEDGHIRTKNFDSAESVTKTEAEFFPVMKNSTDDPADMAVSDAYGNVLMSLHDGAVETKGFRGFTYKTYSSEKIAFNGTQTTLTVNHSFRRGDRVVLHVERAGWKPWDYGVRIAYYEGETQIADNWAGDHAFYEHTVMENVDSFSVVYPASSVANGTSLQFQVSLLGDIPIRPTVVTIKKDGSGDFDNLRDCLEFIGLKANRVLNPYRIEIYPGTYDTLADYSAEEIAATTYPYDQTSFVGAKLLDGMYLVGMGSPQEVILTAELDPEEYDWNPVRGSIATLNLQGSGGIENLTIIAHYIRYCVHDDFHHAKSQKAKRIVKNCVFRGYGITYTPGTTYGAGSSPGGCDFEFINCDFGDNVGVHTVANLTTVHCTNCIGHGFRIGDNQEEETSNPPSEFKFDNCDFTWINQRMVDDVPHVIVRGCGGKSPLYQLNAQTLYATGDVLCVPNVDKQYAYSGVGTLLEWYCNSEHGPRYKPATSYDTACAIVVWEDEEYTYIQTKGYVRTDRTSISSFTVGDYVGISDGEAAIVASESTAIGRITFVDQTGAGYIKLKWKE